ncbi:hypothetical protein HPGAM_08435 [Helicobacter pylori Gambia94/24]|nr:hypothetical protein HPGAM_08435 [Helicobacter pylori Gambia94/24]
MAEFNSLKTLLKVIAQHWIKLFAIKYSIKSSCKNGLYFAPLIN